MRKLSETIVVKFFTNCGFLNRVSAKSYVPLNMIGKIAINFQYFNLILIPSPLRSNKN